MGTTPTKLRIDFKGVDKTAGALKTMRTNIKGFALKAGAAMAGAFAVKAIIGKSADIIQQVHAIGDEARQLGASAEFVQKLGNAFTQVGLDSKIANKSLDFMRRNLATKSDMAGNIFEQMGLDAQELKSMGTEKMFLKIGKEISKLPNEVDKVKASYEIFGRSGSKLVPLFRQGPEAFVDGLKGVMDMIDVVDDGTVDMLSKIDDTFASIKGQMFVDFASGLGLISESAEGHFGAVEIAMFSVFLKAREIASGIVDSFTWAFSAVDAIFSERTQAEAWDKLMKRFGENTKDTEKRLQTFKDGLKAKNKLAAQFKDANNASAKLNKNIKAVKNSLSGLTLSGSYAAVVAGLKKGPAVPFGAPNAGQLAIAGGAPPLNGAAMLTALQDIAKNTKNTDKNTAPLKDVEAI